MKRILILVAVLFLSSALSWAQTAGRPAPVADPRTGSGNCQLPDLAGLAPGQLPTVAMNAGLQVTFEAAPVVPACPVTFHCNSIANCARGPQCFAVVIGPCCSTGGAVLCCASGGNLIEVSCPCKCTGPLCSAACANSNEVAINCS